MKNHCSRHLRLSAAGLDMPVVELSNGISVDEFPIQLRGYVIVGINPPGLHTDDELTLVANIANVGYVGGFYAVKRDDAAARLIREGVGDVEPGWRFRLDFTGPADLHLARQRGVGRGLRRRERFGLWG